MRAGTKEKLKVAIHDTLCGVVLGVLAVLWLQANARLARRGQSHAVEVYRLIARHTIDEQIAKRCGQKVAAQQLILDYFA